MCFVSITSGSPLVSSSTASQNSINQPRLDPKVLTYVEYRAVSNDPSPLSPPSECGPRTKEGYTLAGR
jgi:hypothetical protein